MGCGPSKVAAPAATQLPATTSEPDIRAPAFLPAKKDSLTSKPGDSTDADGSSWDTIPGQPAHGSGHSAGGSSAQGSGRSLPSSHKSGSRRSMDAKLVANNLLIQKAQLPGPQRDYTGLPLQRREDPKLAHITSLASAILKAPVAMVVLGRPDAMLLASAHGVEPQDSAWLPEVCAWALSNAGGVLTIEDMETDLRTHKFTWVLEEPNINFWAGVPVHTLAGDWLGVLCVLDFEPRLGATPLCMSLPNLAEMVARELPAGAAEEGGDEGLFRAMDSYWDGSVLVNVRQGRWRIKYANEAFSSMTGINRQLLPGKDLWDVVEVQGGEEQPWEAQRARVEAAETFDILPVVPAAAFRPPSQLGSAQPCSGSDGASIASDRERTRKFRINMRPNTPEIMDAYGGGAAADVDGWYFAVFTHLLTNSRGSAVAAAAAAGEVVPFDELEMGPIIGRGSFGCVFRAVWQQTLIVAVKVIEFNDIGRMDAAGSPLEASLMLRMKHPNVLETIDFKTQTKLDEQGEAPPGDGGSAQLRPKTTLQFWLMLEFCDMGPLSDGIRGNLFHKDIVASGPDAVRVPLMSVILETALDIARGLAHIHAHSILHGDLTAGNVLLASAPAAPGRRGFVAKIADFGLSRQTITSKVETNTYGTVTHMPPELLNDGILSKAADVYAFGVLLYEMLTQKPVWEGLRHPQIIHAIAVQKRHPEFPPATPACYKSLADRCMAAEPEDRPELEAVVEELAAMLDSKALGG